MNQGKLLALVAAGGLALAAGWYFGVATVPNEQTSIAQGTLLFPGLTPKLAAARRIEITFREKTTTLVLKDGVWCLADRGFYPVPEDKARGLLTALTEIRLSEPRTSDPAAFARLGLEDPTKNDKEGTATLLRVLDGDGKPIAAVITGHRRVRTRGDVPDELDVRLPGGQQTWLAQSALRPDADPQAWMAREIINISAGVITKVVSTRDAGTVELVRDGDKLKVAKPEDHPPLDDNKLSDIANTLDALTLEDVRPAADPPPGDKIGETVFSTTDGLDITVTLFRHDKDVWAHFAVAAPERGKAEADRLNAKLGGWTYQIPSWREKTLLPPVDYLTAEAPRPGRQRGRGVLPAPRPDIPAAPDAAGGQTAAPKPAEAAPKP